jgi:hypothetical protein
MNKKIDSLQAKMQPNKDSSNPTPIKKTEKENQSVTKPSFPSPKKRELIKKNIQPTKSTKEIFYYSDSKQVSLIIEPWLNDKRKLLFYNHKGELTYTQEDVRMSYSIFTSVKHFHSNGAVKEIEIHLNPGASMYMYQSYITFNEDNIPLWKTDTQHPSRLEDHMKPPSYWDQKEKVWKQQEVVIEQPVPDNY